MLYTPLTKKVMKFSFQAHAGQLDKSGIPYVHHPLHLAEQMETEDEVCAALLHDVMEDCGVPESAIADLGVSECVLGALRLLTHDPAIPYLDYVRAMGDARDAGCPAAEIACKVKLADLRHNSQLARLDEVTLADKRRLRKYMRARTILDELVQSIPLPGGRFSVEVDGEPFPFRVTPTPGPTPSDSGRRNGSVRVDVDLLALEVGDIVRAACPGGFSAVHGNGGMGARIRPVQVPGCLRPAVPDCYEVSSDPARFRYRPQDHVLAFLIVRE